MSKIKILIAGIASLIGLYCSAQERKLIQGEVRGLDGPLENVTAVNISSKRASVTDRLGEFQLEMKTGDTLVFSHVGMEDYIKFLDSSDVIANTLDILMIDTFNELDEVNITDASEISAVSLGIIPEEIESLSLYERRLHEAGDFKAIQLLGIVGGSVPLNPILNAISGRTKKLKRNIETEKKIRNIGILEGFRAYMKTSMKLTEDQIGLLLSLAVEEDQVQQVIDSNNDNQIQIFLIDTWLKFQQEDTPAKNPRD